MENACGYIYILTNPSFPEYVKIGYADNVQRRLAELNRSECVPFAFRVYATYEVNSRLSDTKIHAIIDKLNPNLRSIETFEGKKRVREFYAMPPEDAYSILEAIADIHGFGDRLVKYPRTEEELAEDQVAEEIEEEHKERLAPFRFSMCGIKTGEIIEYSNWASPNDGQICEVTGDREVQYHGERYSLSALAQKLTGCRYSVAGPRYFKYHGEWLNVLRRRGENDE